MIDFQPHSPDTTVFNRGLYNIMKRNGGYLKWQQKLPSGGDFPKDAKRYFSPYALWTRIKSNATFVENIKSPQKSVLWQLNSVLNQGSDNIQLKLDESNGRLKIDESYGDGIGDSEQNVSMMEIVRLATEDYVSMYSKYLLSLQNEIPGGRESVVIESINTPTSMDTPPIIHWEQPEGIDEKFLSGYLKYRTEKDPATRLLTGGFGKEWTEAVLSQVMFPSMIEDDPRYTEGIHYIKRSSNITST